MKKLLPVIIAIIIVGTGAFFGGMKYGESKVPQSRFSQADFQSLQSLSPEERQQRLQELGVNGGGFRNRAGGQQGSGFASGQVISKDDKSITVKLRETGSKIIFFSQSTEISKSVSGNLDDIEIGKNISVNGAVNSDGSIIAQTIQLRP